ncbi:M23 family metallopeptidase [Pseudoxanthomonas beigongshangi]
MPFRNVALGAILSFASVAASAQSNQPASFDLHVPVAPMAMPVADGIGLVYELHLANFARHDLQPVRVEVLDGAEGRVLAAYEGAALEQRLDRSGLQWKPEAFPAIPSGRRGVVFIELTIAGAPPRTLHHRVGYLDATASGAVHVVEGGDAGVVTGKTPVLAPPLEGGPWVAIHDPRWQRGHRRVGYALSGKLRTPGRHAIDFVKLDAAGRKAPAGADLATQAYSHGQAVLAVADGVVVRVDDGFPERARLSDRADGVEGNRVVLALDGGRYAHYGHLRPGSARVAPGTRVKAGDRIAEVGFSGSASDPQLHFALTDGPDELASEGIAHAFARYRLLGGYGDVSLVGTTGWTPADKPAPAQAAMPAPMSVIEWRE